CSLKFQGDTDDVFPRLLAAWRLCVTVFEAVDVLLAYCVETRRPSSFIRQDGLINGFQQARANWRMHAESGVDDLLGNGSLAHCRPLWFLAKTPTAPGPPKFRAYFPFRRSRMLNARLGCARGHHA